MSKTKKRINKQRNRFLLSFFRHQPIGKDYYQEKNVQNFWLVKRFDKDAKQWTVALYTQKSFNLYKQKNPTKPAGPDGSGYVPL